MAYCAVCWTVEKRIGVGTESPSHPIHVYDGGNSVYGRWERSTGNMYIGSDSIGGALGATGNIPLYFWTGDGTERMRIACQGNVGIGSTDPLARLHVEQTTTGEVGRFRANVAGCADLVLVNNAQTWGLRIDNAVSNALHIRNFQNSTNIMTFATGGNVGIGTSSPSQKFHVAGTSLFTDTMNFEVGKISWNSTRFVITSCGTANIAFATDDFTDRMTIQCGTGNVGIGTSSPANIIHAYKPSGTATLALQVGGNYGYFFMNGCCMAIGSDSGTSGIKFHISRQAPDDSMLITQAGNVGINTTSPSYRLHVNGTFYAAGSSIKYKEGICNYNTDSCLFMCLKPVTYQYKDEFKHLGKELKSETQIGLIAEHVAEVMPELAILVNEEDNKVVRNVDYEKLSIILLSEVQKLRQEVDDLKNKQ